MREYGHMDPVPDELMGHGHSSVNTHLELTDREHAAWKRELRKKESRRIPVGFAPPDREEIT